MLHQINSSGHRQHVDLPAYAQAQRDLSGMAPELLLGRLTWTTKDSWAMDAFSAPMW